MMVHPCVYGCPLENFCFIIGVIDVALQFLRAVTLLYFFLVHCWATGCTEEQTKFLHFLGGKLSLAVMIELFTSYTINSLEIFTRLFMSWLLITGAGELNNRKCRLWMGMTVYLLLVTILFMLYGSDGDVKHAVESVYKLGCTIFVGAYIHHIESGQHPIEGSNTGVQYQVNIVHRMHIESFPQEYINPDPDESVFYDFLQNDMDGNVDHDFHDNQMQHYDNENEDELEEEQQHEQVEVQGADRKKTGDGDENEEEQDSGSESGADDGDKTDASENENQLDDDPEFEESGDSLVSDEDGDEGDETYDEDSDATPCNTCSNHTEQLMGHLNNGSPVMATQFQRTDVGPEEPPQELYPVQNYEEVEQNEFADFDWEGSVEEEHWPPNYNHNQVAHDEHVDDGWPLHDQMVPNGMNGEAPHIPNQIIDVYPHDDFYYEFVDVDEIEEYSDEDNNDNNVGLGT